MIRLSLKYKLALPVSIFVLLILILLTHTTIRLVREFVVDAFRVRIQSQVETFSDLITPHFILQKFGPLQSHLDRLATRPEVFGVRIEDREGMTILQSPEFRELPFLKERFVGVKALPPEHFLTAAPSRVDAQLEEKFILTFPALYVASEPLELGTEVFGYVQIFFTTQHINETIRKIYRERILFSFLAALAIALLTAVLTWVAIRPLFRLRTTVQDILRGQTEARARIKTGDEIEDLAEAFNEMVGRLQQSLKNLRARSEALEESEERYRALVENASDIIWLLTPEGKIVFLNQGFPGFDQEALLKGGLPLLLTFHSEDSIQKFNAALQQVKDSKTPLYHLAAVYHNPQTQAEIYYSTNLTPVLTRAGSLKAVQASSRDVTELKRVELMKDQLIRDVAHELKTPVAKFQMTLTWLEKELQKEKLHTRYREVLDLMKRNADLLMRIIMEVMDLSRLEFGTERLVRRPCELNQILNRVCDDLEPLVREKKLVLERKLSPEPLAFEGSEEMIYRLFANLVTNALKFTPHGKIVVTSHKNEAAIRASVKDTGVGMENEDLKKVFDRFYQKSPATPGMGLGLALVKEIANLHGGHIWAESGGAEEGSVFIVEFPR